MGGEKSKINEGMMIKITERKGKRQIKIKMTEGEMDRGDEGKEWTI